MGSVVRVAILYAEAKGVYRDADGVDIWCERRDARRYSGNHPVVAHPPCQKWGSLATVNYARWGGEHNRPGNDGGCFLSALSNVDKYGGVLEHPAKTRAWKEYGLLTPIKFGWQEYRGYWVCEVWQSAYGHRANKATWLYYVGDVAPHQLRWDRMEGTHQVGFHDQRGKARNKPTLSKKEANATPIAFREELLKLARMAKTKARKACAEPGS